MLVAQVVIIMLWAGVVVFRAMGGTYDAAVMASGYVNLDWHKYVKIDPRYFRPNEVDWLESDPSRAMKTLDWEPRIFFKDLVRVMMDADLELSGLESPGDGKKLLEKHHGPWHRWDQQVVSMDQLPVRKTEEK